MEKIKEQLEKMGYDYAIAIATQSEIENGVARYRDWETDRKSTRLNSSPSAKSRMPSSA